jgi:hypothetical protein
MDYDPIIERCLREAQNLLRATLPPARQLPDDQAVKSIRALVGTPLVRTALECGNDTACVFALRAVHRIANTRGQPNRKTVDQLWDVLGEPDLMHALGMKRGPPTDSWLKRPPAR